MELYGSFNASKAFLKTFEDLACPYMGFTCNATFVNITGAGSKPFKPQYHYAYSPQ